jgi:hypothetical protein
MTAALITKASSDLVLALIALAATVLAITTPRGNR